MMFAHGLFNSQSRSRCTLVFLVMNQNFLPVDICKIQCAINASSPTFNGPAVCGSIVHEPGAGERHCLGLSGLNMSEQGCEDSLHRLPTRSHSNKPDEKLCCQGPAPIQPNPYVIPSLSYCQPSGTYTGLGSNWTHSATASGIVGVARVLMCLVTGSRAT